MDPTPGPSSQPMDVDASSAPSSGNEDDTPQTPPGDVGSTTADKGKRKAVDWDSVRLVELPSGPIAGLASPPRTGVFSMTPRSAPFRQCSNITIDRAPTRRRTSTPSDSSNIDTVSSTLLPMGKPLPSPTPTLTLPPAKKFRPLGPTPLPPGPPTVQHLRILLEPEHVDMNRPKQFFDLLRKRDSEPPRVQLGPAEIKELLEKMRRVDEIWLRTMGEDGGSVLCVAGWLEEFIGSKNPKLYEGIVTPAIWVILKAKPPIKVLRFTRFGTLAQQCLEKAKTGNLSKKNDIETAVNNLEQLMQMAKKNVTSNSTSAVNGTASGSGIASGSGSTPSASTTIPKKVLPNFKKTNSSSTLPLGGSTSTSSAPAAPTPRPPPSAPPITPGSFGNASAQPPPAIAQNDLAKLLASIMPAVKAIPPQRPNAAAGPSQRPTPEVKPKIEPGPSVRPPYPGSTSSAFRPAPGPAPMIVKREPGSQGPHPINTTNTNHRSNIAGPSSATLPGSSSVPGPVIPSTPASYPSNNNRWSSVATPTGASRPFDGKKMPNWRNRTIRYRDDALAEARLFEQHEYEEIFDPYWWKYGSHGDGNNQTQGQLDREEGHTMRHLHGHEPAIEWYDPPVYDLQATTVSTVTTPECYNQDQRERPILSAYYRTPSEIPHCPDESTVRYVQEGYGTLNIPPMPRATIPRPQPRPPQPVYNQPPPSQFNFGNSFRPRDPPQNNVPQPTATAGPSFRPRNPTPAVGISQAYRPRDRAGSAPAPPTQDPYPLTRRASTPGAAVIPKPKGVLPPSGNVDPQLDRVGTIHYWRREVRPRRSALLNPLSAQQVAENLNRMVNDKPMDYSRLELDADEDEEPAGNGLGPR